MKKFNVISIKNLNILIITCIVVSVVFRIYSFDKISTAGIDLKALDEKLNVLLVEEEKLQLEYRRETSLSKIQERAYEYGLVNAQLEYLLPHDLASSIQNP